MQMYAEWMSLTEEIRKESSPANVLKTFPPNVGKEVVHSVLKPLAEQVHLGSNAISTLSTPEQVQWTMEVIGYGLTLPLSEQTLIASCIDVYDGWLSALSNPKTVVPPPVVDNPNHYAQIIFEQFCELFTPRKGTSTASTHQTSVHVHTSATHAVLCNRTLQITHQVVCQKGIKFTRETWTALLKYLMKIADILLSPPSSSSSLGSTLCQLLIQVLFEAWLRSCVTCFPVPTLWKSLRELASSWRHHHSVVEQWNKLMYSLTQRVVSHLYSSKYLEPIQSSLLREDKDFRAILEDFPNDALVQCWFRMLHTLGNPVDLSYPNKIASLPAFQDVSGDFESDSIRSSKQQVVTPTEECLSALPRIFHEAMKGVSTMVYLFLAHDLLYEEDTSKDVGSVTPLVGGVRPSPLLRHREVPKASPLGIPGSARVKTKWYVAPMSGPTFNYSSSPSSSHPTDSSSLLTVSGEVSKPKGNTLLHLFGEWLFEAAVWPPEDSDSKRRSRTSTLITTISELGYPPEPLPKSHDLSKIPEFEAGRAEAFGALCTIFTSGPCGEAFLPIYLARFYHSLVIGLRYDEELCLGEMLTKIILNSPTLLRKDLQGINVVVPEFLSALSLILPYKELPFRCAVDIVELRRASIHLLLSMLSLPLHFLYQPLPDLTGIIPDSRLSAPSTSGGSVHHQTSQTDTTTFLSLKDQLLDLIFSAIDAESDPTNMQMLLNGLMVIIQDIVTYENAVSKMVSEEVAEDAEVSAIFRDHPPLSVTRSDASTASHMLTLKSSEYALPQLFNKAVEAGSKCLENLGVVVVSLAALELLGALAEMCIEDINHTDCRYAVERVCGYIHNQASKEHPQHKKDLHTSIVAAFTTLLTWINAHPYLLGNKSSLNFVMEVIELGISGSYSTMQDGGVVYKGEKSQKPISGRVKEIAEFMLSCVMEKIGSFPSPCGAESSSSLLSEEDILTQLPPGKRKNNTKFRYFVMDNSIILGLLEHPLSSETKNEGGHSPLPTVTAVVRTPTGRHVWSMQLRHSPRSEEPSTHHLHSMPRRSPEPRNPISQSEVQREPWPDEVYEQLNTHNDDAIPNLENILNDSTTASNDQMKDLTSQQVERENQIYDELQKKLQQLPFPDPALALEPPDVKRDFETARLLLSHLGLLGIEGIKDNPPSRHPALAMLDSSGPNFQNSLCSLDRLPNRFCNTVFVLYCGEGVSKPEDILANQQSLNNKPAEFIEFLHGLGWIVDPVSHPGFAGKIRQSRSNEELNRPISLSAQIPLRPFPYYSNVMMEVAFVMPTLKPSSSDSAASLRSAESSDSGQELASLPGQTQLTIQQQATTIATGDSQPLPPHQPLTSLPSHPSLILKEPQGSGVSESTVQAESVGPQHPAPPRMKKYGSKTEIAMAVDTPRRRTAISQDCAALVVWLERFEDHWNFPLETLTGILHGGSFTGFGSHKAPPVTKKALPVIFIHMLSSGLYQIVARNPCYRQDCMAGPLIDGMVVSRRTLSTLVRQTTINMCYRHRMENEGYSPPHVKRKRKIEEMSSNFTMHIPVAEFYTRLFTEQSAKS